MISNGWQVSFFGKPVAVYPTPKGAELFASRVKALGVPVEVNMVLYDWLDKEVYKKGHT